MQDRLLIKKMELSNCGGFDGDHSIEFSTESEKNFTIIIGTNGRGKSTLFRLIHWCLYGEHFEKKDEYTATEEGIVNLPQLESLKEGASVTGKVALKINNQDGEKYVIERTIVATKHSEESKLKFDESNNSKIDAGITIATDCKLKMKDKRGNDVWEKNIDIIDGEIRKNLPLPLKDFFLFDGENLVSFRTKAGSSRLIQDGIEKISGLNVLDSLIDDVKYSHDKINSSVSGKSISSKGLKNTVDTLSDELDDLIAEKMQKQSDHDKKDKLLEDTIDQISSSKEGKMIEDQIKTEEKIIKKETKNEKLNDANTYDLLFEKIPLMLISDTLKQSEKLFADLEARNLIPPSMSREALDKMFDDKTCICGTTFEENDVIWKQLHEVKKSVLDKDTTQGVTTMRNTISQMIDLGDVNNVEKNLLDLENTASHLDREITEATAKKNKLLEEQKDIGKIKGLNYNELIQLRKDISADLAELRSELLQLKDDIIEKEDKLSQATTDYNLKLQHEGKHTTELAKLSILKAIHHYSKKKRNEIVDNLLNKTEKFTSAYFKSSAPQASEFADDPPVGIGSVKITKNYDISAVSHKGKEKELSKGQAHVLGLSYVAGCRQITNNDIFLFIDSPLHNISGDERNDIAKVLAKNLPNVQIVLFVTDTEYVAGDTEGAKPVREYLNPQTKVWKEWIINVTCTECKDAILSKSKDSEQNLVCKNCNKTYDKKLDKTGRRLITEYERNV